MATRRKTGDYIAGSLAGERYRAFVPAPLPPEPALAFAPELVRAIEHATVELGRLDGIGGMLPDPNLFLFHYVRKEAVLSSQIEGTQSSLSDLLLFEAQEAPGVPLDDVIEVSDYVAALDHGLSRLRKDDFPLSLRLIREMHAVLMRSGRGANQAPGEFRRSQVWIGGRSPARAVFVPPPPDQLQQCLRDFEAFLHDDSLPPLLKAALAHAQFETIHPFMDGNGRIGRLLITLQLCEARVLHEPTFYPSLYFKEHRGRYYDLLNAVRTDGAWESWVRFFMEAVEQSSRQAVDQARHIVALFARDRAKLEARARRSSSLLSVFDAFARRPLQTASRLGAELKLTAPTILRTLALLEDVGVISEVTGQRRNRIWSYGEYLALLSEGTEPL